MMRGIFRAWVDKFPTVANLYRTFRDQRTAARTPALIAAGYRFAGYPSMIDGTFEPVETALVDKLLGDAEMFVNVGANIGYYCCRALFRGVRTIAVEPINTNLHLLCKNIKNNGWSANAEIFPMALSEEPGILEIYGSGTGASLLPGWAGTPEHQVRLVPVSTLEIILGERLKGKRCLILIDVEGAELAVLRGAGNILRADPAPVWMIEISVLSSDEDRVGPKPDFLSTFELFWSHGYQAWTAEAQPRLVTEQQLRAVASGNTNTIGTYNFIFSRSELEI